MVQVFHMLHIHLILREHNTDFVSLEIQANFLFFFSLTHENHELPNIDGN